MSRVRLIGRDWTAPAYRSPWQQDRATRFQPTTLAKFRELYRAPHEPLSHSIGVWVAVIAALGCALFWSVVK